MRKVLIPVIVGNGEGDIFGDYSTWIALKTGELLTDRSRH